VQLEVYVQSSIDTTVKSDSIFITINITKPDLSISSSDIMGLDDMDYLMGKVGNAITISAIIHNDGLSDAKNVQVKLYEDAKLKGTKSISSIGAGSSKNIDFRWTVVAEQVEIKVEITPQEELEENNNEISIFLDLRSDLSFYGQNLDFSNPNPEPGDEIKETD
jgi:subtilase family serine protease